MLTRRVTACTNPKLVELKDVYYATGVVHNLSHTDGENAAFDVGLWRSVLIVQGSVERKREPAADVIMAALEQGVNPANDASDAVQKGTLVEFQKRMDHLTYDHVDRLASGPSSGIELTDHRRVNCLTCAQGKQTKN
ncbi:hypothetical protein PC129_g20417 [Phytophthora cactorum]|uniref:Uncharacterized protein n=1 Tax=Phytophthora cactorum TaxID=29920 RepID=A0A8T1H914_9STRA|nr:hypothetical protein PC128_g27601 [Phytophthora cactorum]KAG3208559.1 hypothetical protein PC129_g20417 [Phytophthora cactorum]